MTKTNAPLTWAEKIRAIWTRPSTPFWAGLTLILIFFVATTLPIVGEKPLEYDEGWNLQAPFQLSQTGTYGSFGSIFEGKDETFDPYLSTGPVVSLPIAIGFRLFDVGIVQARVVMMLFFMFTMTMMAYYVYRQTRNLFALAAPLLALLLVANPPIDLRVDVLGEITAVGFGLASIVGWQKNRYGLAGILAAIAIHAKLVMAFLLPAGCALLLIKLLVWKNKKAALLASLRWCVGAVLPLLIWEIIKFIQLGSVAAYRHNWSEFVRIFKVGGSGFAENGTILSMRDKADMVTSTLGMPSLLFGALVAVLVILVIMQRKQSWPRIKENSLGLVFIAIYLGWWLFQANGGYLRYVVPVMGVGIAIALAISLPRNTDKDRSKAFTVFAAGALLVVIVGVIKSYPYHKPDYSALALKDQQYVVDKLKAEPPQALTHLGWWQNPEIMLMGNMRTTGEHLRPAGQEYDLLLSPIMRRNVPADYAKGLDKCLDIKFEHAGYIYCRAYKAE